MPTDGSAPPRRDTSGRRDVRPRFSPDGRWLAFLRAGDDDKPQLHVMATDGGEPRRVCEHPIGVESFAWSPDSNRIAYVARVPEQGRYGTDKEVPPEKEPPRRITTFQYRLDNLGFTFDRRPHVFVVDALAACVGLAASAALTVSSNGLAPKPLRKPPPRKCPREPAARGEFCCRTLRFRTVR